MSKLFLAKDLHYRRLGLTMMQQLQLTKHNHGHLTSTQNLWLEESQWIREQNVFTDVRVTDIL